MRPLAVAFLVETAAAMLLFRGWRVSFGIGTALVIASGVFAYWLVGGFRSDEPLWRRCVYCGRRIWLWWRAVQDQGWLHPGCYELALIDRVRRGQSR